MYCYQLDLYFSLDRGKFYFVSNGGWRIIEGKEVLASGYYRGSLHLNGVYVLDVLFLLH